MKNHSVYKYVYITHGELIAYLIGWNTVINGLLAGSIGAEALSSYFRSLLEGMQLLTALDIQQQTLLQLLFYFPLNSYTRLAFMPSVIILVLLFYICIKNTYYKTTHYVAKQWLIYCLSWFNFMMLLIFIICGFVFFNIDIFVHPCSHQEFDDVDYSDGGNDIRIKCSENEIEFLPDSYRGIFAASAITSISYEGLFLISTLVSRSLKSDQISKGMKMRFFNFFVI